MSIYDDVTATIPAVAAAQRAAAAVHDRLAALHQEPAPQPMPDPTERRRVLLNDTAEQLTSGADPGAVLDGYTAELADLALRPLGHAGRAAQISGLRGLGEYLTYLGDRAVIDNADQILDQLGAELRTLLGTVREASTDVDLAGQVDEYTGIRDAQRDVTSRALGADETRRLLPAGGWHRDLATAWPAWRDPLPDRLGQTGEAAISRPTNPAPWPHTPGRALHPDPTADLLRWAAAQPDGTVWVPGLAQLREAHDQAHTAADRRDQDHAGLTPAGRR